MIPGLAFTWHVPAIVALVVAYVVFRSFATTRRRHFEIVGVLAAAAAVLLWPMGNLAQSVSLSAAVVQRLVLMILVVPVLVASVPTGVVERLTRPRLVDAVTYQLARPVVAMLFVTFVGTMTLMPVTIDWAAHSWFGNAVVIVATVIAGVVLWVPALSVLPGARHLSPAGRAGYVFVSALVVTSFSFIWILATHSLYPGLNGQEAILGVSAVFDQQFAGFLAKLGSYFPMWAISFAIFLKADAAEHSTEESPLHWADVERHLLRVDRQRKRAQRRATST